MTAPVNSHCNLKPWRPGQSGNPAGKPKGTLHGRARALKLLDSVLEEPKTLERLREALLAYILRDPVRAFRVLIMPLIPREARLEVDNEPRQIIWRSLVSAAPKPDSEPPQFPRPSGEPAGRANP
jgi:hypothetical protein